jgi:hypothetical protein
LRKSFAEFYCNNIFSMEVFVSTDRATVFIFNNDGMGRTQDQGLRELLASKFLQILAEAKRCPKRSAFTRMESGWLVKVRLSSESSKNWKRGGYIWCCAAPASVEWV